MKFGTLIFLVLLILGFGLILPPEVLKKKSTVELLSPNVPLGTKYRPASLEEFQHFATYNRHKIIGKAVVFMGSPKIEKGRRKFPIVFYNPDFSECFFEEERNLIELADNLGPTFFAAVKK